MVEVTSRLIFLVAFLAGLTALIYWDRKNVERSSIIFYRRTERGLELIDDIAERFPKLWNYYGWTGVLTGLLSVVVSTVLIGQVMVKMSVTVAADFIGREQFVNFLNGLLGEYSGLITGMISDSVSQNGPSVLLPGLVSQNQFQAGVSFIPVEYWVISIAVLMVVHEMSHGVVARAEQFELNSVGWVIMGILPGAFVEPKGENMLPGDEKDDSEGGMWDQGSWTSRLKVLGAGSFANYLTAIMFLISGVAVSGTVTEPGETQLVYSSTEGFPAQEAGMTQGVIHQVNGINVSTQQGFQNLTANFSEGENISFVTSEGNFTVQGIDREGHEGGYIGIRYGETASNQIKDSYSEHQGFLQWFVSMLWTAGLLNLMIGLFNMLPIKPLDGGLMVETLLEEHRGEDSIKYLDSFSMFGWLFLIASIIIAVIGV